MSYHTLRVLELATKIENQKWVEESRVKLPEEGGRKVKEIRSQLRTSNLNPKHYTRSEMSSAPPLCPTPSLSPARHPVPLFPKTRLGG